jgi:hypothetical protein
MGAVSGVETQIAHAKFGRRPMARESQAETSSSAMPDWFGARIAEIGAKQTAALVKMQAQVFDVLQGWNRQCLARAQSEAELATATADKLMSARSIPETATAYREWLDRRMNLFGEDSEQFFTESQKILDLGGQHLANSLAEFESRPH